MGKKPKPVGRPPVGGDVIAVRHEDGTIAAIDAVLRPKEGRSDFVRTAVSREISRRERAAKQEGGENG